MAIMWPIQSGRQVVEAAYACPYLRQLARDLLSYISRGKGSKIMAVADRGGLPLAIHVASASPAEVRLVVPVLELRFTDALAPGLIGDKAYDGDGLDEQLRSEGIEMIAPNRAKRRKTKDRRRLRRYRRRWKVGG